MQLKMKKTIITLLIVVFQLLSCKAQDYKNNIIGNWEQEYYNDNGDENYIGEIWTFYSDGTCKIDYGPASGHSISKFYYDITKNNCTESPIASSNLYFLKMTVISGEDEDRCWLISEINNTANSEGKIIMGLYATGANGNNVFVKRP